MMLYYVKIRVATQSEVPFMILAPNPYSSVFFLFIYLFILYYFV